MEESESKRALSSGKIPLEMLIGQNERFQHHMEELLSKSDIKQEQDQPIIEKQAKTIGENSTNAQRGKAKRKQNRQKKMTSGRPLWGT